jgi:amicyanin
MKKSVLIVILVVVVIGGFIAFRGSSGPVPTSTSSTPTANSAATTQTVPNAITIKNYAFSPEPLTVKAGTTVTWTNKDIARHNIVADVPSANAPAGALFGQNETFSFTFSAPGTYAYHCDPHPYMKGTVIVTQ